MKMELVILDVCTCDYWKGTNLPYLQVEVDSQIKVYEVKEKLRSLMRWGDVQGTDKTAQLLSADFIYGEDDQKLAIKLTRAAYAAVNKLRFQRRSNIFNLSFCNDENAEQIYAYFGLVEV